MTTSTTCPARRVRMLAPLVLGLPLAATLALPAAAQAASYQTDDPVGDVTYTDPGGDQQPRPDATSVDLTHARFDYRRQYLVVVGTAVDAMPEGYPLVTVKAGTRTFTYHGTPRGRVSADYDADPVPCPGGTSARNEESNTYRIKIPASCLGSPAGLKVRFSLARDDDSYATTTDDTLDGRYSPRLLRG